MTQRRWLIWTAAVVAVVLLTVLRFFGERALERLEFSSFVERLHAAGEPTTFVELNGPEPPPAENAAGEIGAALNSVYAEFGREKTWPDVGPWGTTEVKSFEDDTPQRVAADREFVRRFEPFCDRVAAALERPRIRVALVLGPDGVPDGSATRTLQAVQRILAAEALVADDPVRRIAAARCLLLLANHNEPLSSIDSLVGAAIAASAANALRIGVERSEIDPVAARTQLDGLLRKDWTAVGSRFFRAHMVETVSLFSTALDGHGRQETVVAGCEMLREAARLPTAPFAAYRRGVKAIDERALAEENPVVIVVLRAVDTLGRIEAQCRLARVVLAVAEHRTTHGEFPASLDELTWAFPDGMPLDPYTDRSFIYEKTPAGVRIASVGRVSGEPELDFAALREKSLVWELKR